MLGTSIGVPMFLCGLLADVPVIAVVAIAALGVGDRLIRANAPAAAYSLAVIAAVAGAGGTI